MCKQTETATIVNGVVLTEPAIKQLVSFQQSDNEYIRAIREDLSDAISMLAILTDEHPHEQTVVRARRTMINLSYIRDNIDDLRKP